MIFPLIVRPAVEADLAAAKQWYDSERQGLGDKFLEAVENMLKRISQFPEIHVAGYREVRHTLLRRFPYVVYYRFKDERVTVIAVLHGSRHERVWKRRS
jgi:plasmid stabilization system protein ParE